MTAGSMPLSASAGSALPRPRAAVLSAAWLLLLGGAAVYAALFRFGVAELGWVAFAPFLVVLHRGGSLRRHLALLAALLATMLLAAGKIATEEISRAFAPMFAIPIALSYFAMLALAGAAHRRLGARWGVYTFAAMAAALGWVQYGFTQGASWGVLAHTQADNLPLVQLASLTGVGGISFLVALGSSLAAAAWSGGARALRADLLVLGALLASALLFGQLRLARPAPGEPVRVGAVVSPVTFRDFRAARAGVGSIRRHDDELFARTERAAGLGARAVVWNEVATLVDVPGEEALAARGQELARRRGVLLLMAYGVIESVEPFRWVNKYRLFLPDGTLADDYQKRHPVPGDGDVAGLAHAKVVSFGGARLTGAICYDYSFPEIARDNANDGAGLALVPASDWRGIDPLHGRMARMNAVAAGVAMVRPVRAATTIATDAYGRVLGALRADLPGEAVMVVEVPAGGVPTLYARTGEIVPLAALFFCALAVVQVLRAGRGRMAPGRTPAARPAAPAAAP